MKLASLKGGRDGRLVVVSDDLAWFAGAAHIATTLQAALDDWDRCEGALRNLATDLEHGAIPKDRFHEREAAAPLPRIYGRVGGSGAVLAARDAISLGSGCSGSATVVVVTGDVPAGISPDEARTHIRLVGLAHDVSLSGDGRDASAYSPVFVTPDSLGARWDGSRFSGPIRIDLGGASHDRAEASDDFGALIAQAARTRGLGAGAVMGSEAAGSALTQGDTIRIWAEDDRRHSIFGAIEQTVT